MSTMTRPCHFVTRAALVRYYKSQEYDIAAIQQKLDEGAVFVGRPILPLGDLCDVNDEGRYVIYDDPEQKMRSVRLLFADSKYNYVTSCNGTRKSVCQYFNNPLNVGDEQNELILNPIGIVFIGADGKHETTISFPQPKQPTIIWTNHREFTEAECRETGYNQGRDGIRYYPCTQWDMAEGDQVRGNKNLAR